MGHNFTHNITQLWNIDLYDRLRPAETVGIFIMGIMLPISIASPHWKIMLKMKSASLERYRRKWLRKVQWNFSLILAGVFLGLYRSWGVFAISFSVEWHFLFRRSPATMMLEASSYDVNADNIFYMERQRDSWTFARMAASVFRSSSFMQQKRIPYGCYESLEERKFFSRECDGYKKKCHPKMQRKSQWE